MSRAAPAIPFFGDAYIADTRHLSLEEHGAYLQLLMIAWRSKCALPDDDKRIATMLGITAAKWARLKPTIMAFWRIESGRWTQKRLKKERAFVSEKRVKNVEAANARWNGQPTENKGTGRSERISKRTSERICQTDAPPPPVEKDKDKPLSKKPLPDDWEPQPFGDGTQSRRIVDGWPAMERAVHLEEFRAHHRKHGEKFTDWQAAWSTWVLRSERFTKPRSNGAAAEPGSFLESVLRQEENDRIKRERAETRPVASG